MRASIIKGIVIGLVVLLTMNGLLGHIDKLRVEKALIETSAYEALTPGEFVGTVALAGFRAMAVDMLWVRAIDLWREKDWYQALTVYRLISNLQPHHEEVWVSNSWNMAVNIAVNKRQNGEDAEAWEWVREALDYLKEGISRNPKSHYLHFYYGWLTYRMGQDQYYRDQLERINIDPLEESLNYVEKAATMKGPHYAYDSRLAFLLHEKGVAVREAGDELKAVALFKRSKSHMKDAFEVIPDGPEGSLAHVNFLKFRETLSEEIDGMDRLIQEMEAKGVSLSSGGAPGNSGAEGG